MYIHIRNLIPYFSTYNMVGKNTDVFEYFVAYVDVYLV